MEDRTCTMCGVTKPNTDYYRNVKGIDGLLSQCKACVGQRRKARYDSDLEYRQRMIQLAQARYTPVPLSHRTCKVCSTTFVANGRRTTCSEQCSLTLRNRRTKPKGKRPHYSGTYHAEARRVREAAYASEWTRCWRCLLTLAEHPPHKNGSPARWTAGHINDGEVGGALAPEASTCNMSAGASAGNRKREPHSEMW